MRVNAYIDGFNLYHAIKDDHLKWLNLWALARIFCPPPQFSLNKVYYFSAYATWLPAACARHREYVKALEAVEVTPIMGHFKVKDRRCTACNTSWKAHEEKQTDINIALQIVKDTYDDACDLALILSSDSDIAPAIVMARNIRPDKRFKILTPRNHHTSFELVAAAGGSKCHSPLRTTHFQRSLLGKFVEDSAGKVVATRPVKYDPPHTGN
jgi:hypothetical protein